MAAEEAPNKLLVIEDDEAVRSILVELLAAENFVVRDAANGANGIQIAREFQPDVILCDVMMPGLSGYEVLAALRRDPSTALIPLIFVTGMAESGDVRRGMEHGADDYLTKPFRRAEVLRAVEVRLFRHREARRQAQRRLEELRRNIAQAVPHEFLTPLTAVLGLASFLKDEISMLEPDAVREVAQGIFEGGERLQELIAQFLLYAELESVLRDDGAVRALRQHAYPNAPAVVEEVARKLAVKQGRLDDLVLRVQPATPAITREHLTGLVEEPLKNGFTFSTAGQSVTLDFGPGSDGDAVLRVVDQGRGMSAEEVAALGAYIQHSRRKYEQPGAGLGIAIMKQIAAVYDGRFKIDSTPGSGTTVEVRLPGPRASA